MCYNLVKKQFHPKAQYKFTFWFSPSSVMTRPTAIVNMLCFLSTKPGVTGRPSDKRRGVTESWLSKRWKLLWTAKERILSGQSWCALTGMDCSLPFEESSCSQEAGLKVVSIWKQMGWENMHESESLQTYWRSSLNSLTYWPSQRQDHLIPSIMWTPFSWILESPPPCQALSQYTVGTLCCILNLPFLGNRLTLFTVASSKCPSTSTFSWTGVLSLKGIGEKW